MTLIIYLILWDKMEEDIYRKWFDYRNETFWKYADRGAEDDTS